jgi:hypothetical protein
MYSRGACRTVRMYSRLPYRLKADTCAGNRYFRFFLRLLVAAAFSRSLRFLPLCAPTPTGLSRVSRHSPRTLSCNRNLVRPTEVAFHSPKYCHRATRSLSRGTASCRCSCHPYYVVVVLNSSSRFAPRIHDTRLLFLRALFLKQYHADEIVPSSTDALSDHQQPTGRPR